MYCKYVKPKLRYYLVAVDKDGEASYGKGSHDYDTIIERLFALGSFQYYEAGDKEVFICEASI